MNAYFNVTVKITKAEMLVSSFGSTLFLNLFANRHPTQSLHVGVDYLHKVGLKAGAANETAIYIGTGGQLAAVGRGHTTSIQDPQVLGYLDAHVILEPLPECSVDLLCLRGRRGLARADRPDRLVSQYHAGPVCDMVGDGLELREANLLCLARLPLLQLLADAGQHLEAVLEAELDLLADERVALTQDVPPLRVAENDPLAAHVLDHAGADLPGEGALRRLVAVLRGDANALSKLAANVLEVDGGDGDDDLCRRVKRARGQELADSVDRGLVPVHLPVASNEELSVGRHFDFPDFGLSFSRNKMEFSFSAGRTGAL